MTDYFVSPSGSDSNDGKTVTTPWATIAKVNAALNAHTVKQGESVLFQRGQTFYGDGIKMYSTLPTSGDFLAFGAYGAGSKPIISGYKILTNASAWVLHATNVWKIDLTNTANYSGNQDSVMVDTGFLKVDGAIFANKFSALASLAAQWDFYSDTTYLYVYSTAKPTTLCTDLRTAPTITFNVAKNSTKFIGLDITGFGYYGFNSGTSAGCSNFRVLGNRIHEIGGGYIQSSTTRAGGALDAQYGANNWVVADNEVHDIFDEGLSIQGAYNSSVGAVGWRDITFERNTLYRCRQSFEFDAAGPGAPDGSQYQRCVVRDNVAMFAGYSFAGPLASKNPNTRVHLNSFGWDQMTTPHDLLIENNVFYGARQTYSYQDVANPRVGWTQRNNIVFLRAGQGINNIRSETVENSAAWVAGMGQEVGTQFIILAPAGATAYADQVQQVAVTAALAASRAVVTQRGLTALRAEAEQARQKANSAYSLAANAQSYTTNLSTTGTEYAHLCDMLVETSTDNVDVALLCMLDADSAISPPRNGTFLLRLRLASGASSPTVNMHIAELIPLSTASDAIRRQDFSAVLTRSDTANGKYTIAVYAALNDAFQRVTFFPAATRATGTATFAFYDQAAVVSALPGGTVTNPDTTFAYNARPTTGTAAPATTPSYIGQEYVDTSAKKFYKAVGTGSSADWVTTSSGPTAGPRHIAFETLATLKAFTGTAWSYTQSGSAYKGGYLTQSGTAAINDTCTFYDVWLDSGTWKLDVAAFANTDGGILTAALVGPDGTVAFANNQDQYAATAAPIRTAFATGVTITTAGLYTLVLTMASKNASSTGYKARVSAVDLVRTA